MEQDYEKRKILEQNHHADVSLNYTWLRFSLIIAKTIVYVICSFLTYIAMLI